MSTVEIIGISIGDWYVLDYIGDSKYLCKCNSCGEIRAIRKYYLTANPPKCKHNNIIGKTFGKLTVVSKDDNGFVTCQCSCGNPEFKTVHRRYLQNGTTTSCGCDKAGKTSKLVDINGETFGNWMVTGYLGDKFWECKCVECGHIKRFRGHILRNGTFEMCKHFGREPAVIKHFGDWTVVDKVPNTTKWLCICSCGNKAEVEAHSLISGKSKSCGHNTTGLKDLTGQMFGNWKVLRKSPIQTNNRLMWECECQCDNHTIRDIDSYLLRSGKSKSCGCMTNELREKTNRDKYGVKHPSMLNSRQEREKELLDVLDNRETLIKFIKTTFGDHKPSFIELADALKVTRGSIKEFVKRHDMLDYMSTGTKQISGYEYQLGRLFPGAVYSDRSILEGKELDLYFPDKQIAIEFNGNYWHSELKKDKNYHYNKSMIAESKGVHVFHIFEYEWNNLSTRNKIIENLKSRLYPENNNVVYARDCQVGDLKKEVAIKFVDNYHMQGYTHSDINIGLAKDNEVIAVMTFGRPRFSTDAEYELIRMTFKFGYIIPGGVEKMFKYFINKYTPESIISYCDIAKFNGRSYERLGFEIDHITKPGYTWVNVETGEYRSRYSSQKHLLLAQGIGKPDQTESEIMHSIGYNKIYNCGNKVFVWKSKNEGGEA